jgi:poly(3-hydroxyalkanoate) synthetase
MAGAGDDITPYPQVFAAEKKLSTPKDKIVKKLAPGGHIGLFMGSRTLKDSWPGVVAWIKQECPSA